MKTKSTYINVNYHKALQIVKSETGASMHHSIHVAIRKLLEDYHPHIVPVLSGGIVDDGQRLEPFRNHD